VTALKLGRVFLVAVAALGACGDDEPSPPQGTPSAQPGADGAVPTEGGVGVLDGGTNPDGAAQSDSAASDAGKVAGPLFGFVGSSDGKIRVFAIDEVTGAWTLKKENSAGANPSFLAIAPSQRRVLAVDEDASGGLVRSFSFEPSTGALTEINNRPTGGDGPAHVSIDPTGTWAFVANYTGGTASVLPLASNGMLGAIADTKTSGAMSHFAGTNPSGTYVFVPALGDDIVSQYALDANTGKLTANGVANVPANAGPRHLAFHPSEQWAYVMNETAITVTTFDFAKTAGTLSAKETISALPGGQSTNGVSGAEIFVHPSGKYVYGSTRIYDSIAVFTVDGTTGKLTRTMNATTGANRPRSFGIDPMDSAGTLLYAGNQDADEVVGFRIDLASGNLTSLGKVATVKGPSFVGLARIP
jgi:6-phosphogluconolactonase